MCDRKRLEVKAIIDNLKIPMPIGRKARLFIRNNILKTVRMKSCCGHPGEPGC
jgi:hypothetical protein